MKRESHRHSTSSPRSHNKDMDPASPRSSFSQSSVPADPADFGKHTTPVRERMAKALRDTPPSERMKGH